MNEIICKECSNPVDQTRERCASCGALVPHMPKRTSKGFEWRTRATFLGFPLIHVAFGRDDEQKLRIAKGWIAIGQFALGVITIAQFGVGIVFGLGQFMTGIVCVAQFAGAVYFGLGQFATGYIAIGQVVFGSYGLCQVGIADYLWNPKHQDPIAVDFFKSLWERVALFFS